MAINLPTRLNLIFNPIGMACSLLVLLSILLLSIFDIKSVNRMTVRLIAVIALTDLLAHIGEFISAWNGQLPLDSTTCHVVNGFRLFSRSFYCFTNLAICFHLYRGIVLLKKSTWRYEIYTWTATLVAVVIITVVYWALGALTGVQHKKGCNPGSDDKVLNIIFFITQASINVITILVGIFTTVVGHISLNNYIKTYASSRSYSGSDHDQAKFKKDRRKMASRSFLYPLSTCITLPFEAAFLYCNAANIFVIQLATLMALGTGLSGTLTFIAFVIDPAVHKAFSSAYTRVKGNIDNHSTLGNDVNETAITTPLAQKV